MVSCSAADLAVNAVHVNLILRIMKMNVIYFMLSLIMNSSDT